MPQSCSLPQSRNTPPASTLCVHSFDSTTDTDFFLDHPLLITCFGVTLILCSHTLNSSTSLSLPLPFVILSFLFSVSLFFLCHHSLFLLYYYSRFLPYHHSLFLPLCCFLCNSLPSFIFSSLPFSLSSVSSFLSKRRKREEEMNQVRNQSMEQYRLSCKTCY